MFPCLQGTPMAYRYNTPNVDASLRYLLVKSSCEVESVEDNVQKTSFSCSSVRLGANTKFAGSGTCRARNPICLDPPPTTWANGSGTKLQINLDIKTFIYRKLRDIAFPSTRLPPSASDLKVIMFRPFRLWVSVVGRNSQ